MHPEDDTPKQRAGVANFGKRGEVENNSIGSGSSDQGMEADDQSREDDILAMEDEQLNEKDENRPSHRPPPTHGLVEEGPGRDS
ncbi:MAG: hypothetical protein ABI151_16640 [Chitinophagaceae bacterium]